MSNRALGHYEASQAASLALRDQYDLRPGDQDKVLIAGLHQQINYGLKSAEVCALIAIAMHLETLAGLSLDPVRSCACGVAGCSS